MLDTVVQRAADIERSAKLTLVSQVIRHRKRLAGIGCRAQAATIGVVFRC